MTREAHKYAGTKAFQSIVGCAIKAELLFESDEEVSLRLYLQQHTELAGCVFRQKDDKKGESGLMRLRRQGFKPSKMARRKRAGR